MEGGLLLPSRRMPESTATRALRGPSPGRQGYVLVGKFLRQRRKLPRKILDYLERVFYNAHVRDSVVTVGNLHFRLLGEATVATSHW